MLIFLSFFVIYRVIFVPQTRQVSLTGAERNHGHYSQALMYIVIEKSMF